MSIEWRAEGDGWVGRWVNAADYGPMGELEIAPEGGLHGGWAWSFTYGPTRVHGVSPCPDTATEACEACFMALGAVGL